MKELMITEKENKELRIKNYKCRIGRYNKSIQESRK